MAPAADHKTTQEGLDRTFLLSNMTAQVIPLRLSLVCLGCPVTFFLSFGIGLLRPSCPNSTDTCAHICQGFVDGA